MYILSRGGLPRRPRREWGLSLESNCSDTRISPSATDTLATPRTPRCFAFHLAAHMHGPLVRAEF